MSRYASPSPSDVFYDAAPRARRGRAPPSREPSEAGSWAGRSCSRSASSRQQASESRGESRSRSRCERPARSVHGVPRPSAHVKEPRGVRGRDRLRDKGREREKVGRHRKRDYSRKLGQQAPLHMAMMQGMMMHPMQMAMMGMVAPPFLAAMQRPPGSSQAGRSKRHAGAGTEEGRRPAAEGRASSSSSSDSSESESSAKGEVINPAAAMAMAAAMWPAAAASGATDSSVEAFLASCPIDPEAAKRMRALPMSLQQSIIRRGPIADTRNPSAVLIARVRDAEAGKVGEAVGGGGGSAAVAELERGSVAAVEERGSKPARRSAKVTIEAMIRDYRLSPGCAWMLRALPPDKQKLAARIDPAGQADPSGFVAEQLKKIV